MNTLTPKQIGSLNEWISNQYDTTASFYQYLVEVGMAYARMYVTLTEMNLEHEAKYLGDRDHLYILSELMNIFKPE